MYDEMVLNGRLHEYLLTINDQAEQRMELLVQQMKEAQGVRRGERGTGDHLRVNEKAVNRQFMSVHSFFIYVISCC